MPLKANRLLQGFSNAIWWIFCSFNWQHVALSLSNSWVSCYISLEKHKKLQYLCNSVTDLHKIWHDKAERVCRVDLSALAVNNLILKWRWYMLERPILQHHVLLPSVCHLGSFSAKHQFKCSNGTWSTDCNHGKSSSYTHTHPFNGPFPGLPRWAGTRKLKPIWILLKQDTVSGSGISWAICKSALRCRQITTPSPHHSVFYRPDALPAAQPTVSKHWRLLILLMLHELTFAVRSASRNPIHCI